MLFSEQTKKNDKIKKKETYFTMSFVEIFIQQAKR